MDPVRTLLSHSAFCFLARSHSCLLCTTRPKLSSLVRKTEGKALIGMVGGIIGDYLPLVDDYYFYSAT